MLKLFDAFVFLHKLFLKTFKIVREATNGIHHFKFQNNFSVFTIVSLGIVLMSCSSSEYICFKVKKSELMPDSYELSMDSLIVGGLKICKLAQRYYGKTITMGGGGNSFTGFTIPPYLVATEFGTYIATVAPAIITVTGVSNQMPITVVYTVTPDTIATTIN